MQIVEDFFTYEVDFSSIDSAAQATSNINVQADSDFKWIKSYQMTDIAGAGQDVSTQIVPLATVVIVDSGSGRQLMSGAVPIPNLFGVVGNPYILPIPRIFKARSNIAFTVANYDAADTYRIRLSLEGTKLFQLG